MVGYEQRQVALARAASRTATAWPPVLGAHPTGPAAAGTRSSR
jgi:hypothetical protein